MPPTGTQAIDRAAELLRLVLDADGSLGFADLADTSGLSRSTTSRVLAALERHGLVSRGEDGTYEAGDLFLGYAARHDSVTVLTRMAAETMRRIGDATGETVNLAVARGDSVLQVAQVASTYLLGTTDWVGVVVPPHTSALGKVMYAYGALPAPSQPLPAVTPETVTDPDALAAELARVRDQGYATTRGELEEGLAGVAVGVLWGGQVAASLGVSGPTFRLEGRFGEIGELLRDETLRLTKALDGHE